MGRPGGWGRFARRLVARCLVHFWVRRIVATGSQGCIEQVEFFLRGRKLCQCENLFDWFGESARKPNFEWHVVGSSCCAFEALLKRRGEVTAFQEPYGGSTPLDGVEDALEFFAVPSLLGRIDEGPQFFGDAFQELP